MGGRREAQLIAALVEPGVLVAGAEVELPQAEAHHLKVRRAEVGSALHLQDGAGTVARATLLGLDRRARVRVETVTVHSPLPLLRLVVGAGDRDRFEWLAEKSAEFGVTELVPLETALTRSVATRLRAAHVERVVRRAREAIKQSGAAWAPLVTSPLDVDEACARYATGARWLAQAGGVGPEQVAGAPLTAVIGPEGGLTDGECRQFTAAGFVPVSLAPHILRFETAAIAIAALARAPLPGGKDD